MKMAGNAHDIVAIEGTKRGTLLVSYGGPEHECLKAQKGLPDLIGIIANCLKSL